MARRRGGKQSGGGAIAWGLGAAALGAGAGLVLERLLLGRGRNRVDPAAGVPYGKLEADRRYEVSTFDGGTLLVEEMGSTRSKSGLIFLHGFCLDRTIWHHQVTSIGERRRCIFYDARDHGLSRGGHADATVKTLAKDLKSVLDQTGLRKAVLVGHSMGGMTALEFCREHPEELGDRVLGLVLVNTTYTDAVKTLVAAEIVAPVERRIRRILNSLLDDPRRSAALRIRGDDLSWFLVRVFGFGPGASPTQIEYTQKLLTSFPNPPLVGIMRGLRDFDMEEALHKISVPTLILAGGDDRVTTVRASQKMVEEIPQSELVVMPKAGHMTMLERYEECNRLLTEFTDTILPKSRARSSSNGKSI